MRLANALAYGGRPHLQIDPRTKLVILLCVNAICLGAGFSGGDIWVRGAISIIPLLLLVIERRFVLALICGGATTLALVMEMFWLGQMDGFVELTLAGCANLAARFVPGMLTGIYLLSTTTLGEFMAALAKVRLPRAVALPTAVVLRFIPTLALEAAAIQESMRMRGVFWGGGKPGAFFTYRVVPLMICAVNMGDELTAAALTRALGNPGQRISLTRIRLRLPDWILIACCLGILGIWLVL
ncbi:MAG: energy-coupling factor transporter transmembrane protein EcfT [Propionibacteriaceae bacterium]|nr:energy-coupling factor transporter transmembrane protein EcfT [Propionibacteriaceae bacterium]